MRDDMRLYYRKGVNTMSRRYGFVHERLMLPAHARRRADYTCAQRCTRVSVARERARYVTARRGLSLSLLRDMRACCAMIDAIAAMPLRCCLLMLPLMLSPLIYAAAADADGTLPRALLRLIRCRFLFRALLIARRFFAFSA